MKNLFLLMASIFLLSCVGTGARTVSLSNVHRTTADSLIQIDINYPVADSTGAVVDSINRYVGERLGGFLADSAQMVGSGDPYENYVGWSACLNDRITQISFSSYLFTGGAHGMSLLTTAAFDNKTGARVDLKKHITDSVCLLKLIGDRLIADSVDLFNPVDQLPLPTYLGVDDQALIAIYNQYEIAPYSNGILQVKIPYGELAGIFDTTAIVPSSLKLIQCPTTILND